MSKDHMNYLRRKTADETERWAADRIEQLEAEVERLKTTPAHKREDLHCVISDICEQVRAREEQLEAVTNQRDEWVKTACKLPEVSAALKFAVEQGVKFQQQLAECQAALALKDEAFQTYVDAHGECSDSDDWMAMMCSVEAHHCTDEALAIKPDNQALREYIKRYVEQNDKS